MKLKKLIVTGFKSFADKVTLSFDDGITGIVGPNGSGKSNVIDAVRWVMGEQSAKHLRGQVATDIIFAGSDKRKALGMAEVTLVFDNAEGSDYCPAEYRHEPEIALTRRLYIDGQREYLINKKPCRFKDIVGFFATTGLGGRSYSMIQQGQVDRILNAKPEDVREILEEAAGTLVYKTRRIAAMKKFTTTSENLSRIDDLVTELNRQMETLQTQVEKAREWQECSEELREKELQRFAHDYHFLNQKLQELDGAVAQNTDEEVRIMGELAAGEARHEGLQAALAEADPELEKIREKVSLVREEIIRIENSINNSFALQEDGERRLEEIDEEVATEATAVDQAARALEESTEELEKADTEQQRLQELIESFQDEVDRSEEHAMVFQNRAEQLESDLKNLVMLLDQNSNRTESIERDRQRALNDLGDCQERLAMLEKDLQGATEKIDTARQEADRCQQGLDEKMAAKTGLEKKLRELEEDVRDKQEVRDRLREDLVRQQARRESLDELIRSAGDLNEAWSRLEEEDAVVTDLVHGRVSDHLSLREGHRLSDAAVTSIDMWSEALIVDQEEDLQKLAAIAFRCQAGRFRVLLRRQQPPAGDHGAFAARTGLRSLAGELRLEEGGDLGSWMERLWYAEDPDLAGLRDLPAGMLVFTADGLVISSAGDEYLVNASAATGVLTRRQEAGELDGKIAGTEAELTSVIADLDELGGGGETARQELRGIDDFLAQHHQEALGAQRQLQSALQERDHKQDLYEGAEKHLQQLDESARIFGGELEELGRARISMGQEQETLKNELETLQDESLGVTERTDEIRRQHDQRKMDLAAIEARCQALREGHDHRAEQLDRARATLQRREEEKARIVSQLAESRESDATLAAQMQEEIARRSEMEAVLNIRREQNAGLLEEIRQVEAELKKAREQQSKFQKEKNSKSLEMERARIALEGINEQAQEKYQLDMATYECELSDDFDSEKTGRQVKRLRDRIEAMGAINMMAIEEFEKLSERQQFIDTQREEVARSISLLEDAIAEIEDTARKKFLSAFETINHNFADLFPVLFPGGDARLHLTDEEDPLNSGVDILVRLPGKKQRSMSLFSGGEKALTAISLIFALLKTKPTPFCFLDEVDAPLDEANVGRYNKVLEFLAQRFQFVVITHNRRTMEVLDQLYGVTMQEGGVSRVVGVDLNKDLPAHLQKAFSAPEAVAGASAAPP